MDLSFSDPVTVRDLLEEVARRGGEGLRHAIWTPEGQLERSVMIAVDGEVLPTDQLDAPLVAADAAEVPFFLIRPIFGGQGDQNRSHHLTPWQGPR